MENKTFTQDELRQQALKEVVTLAIKKTDMRFKEINRTLMKERIDLLVSRWGFTYNEVWEQMKKQSK